MESGPPFTPQSDGGLRRFFDLALDLLVIAGFDNNYKRVNAALERTLGHPREELLSRPFSGASSTASAGT